MSCMPEQNVHSQHGTILSPSSKCHREVRIHWVTVYQDKPYYASERQFQVQNFNREAILDRIDRLRLKRNPFAHLKEMNHEHSLGARSVSQGRHPVEVLEEDGGD